MRVEIVYKFVSGFIIVVGSIVGLGYVVPLLGIEKQWQQLFTTAVAILTGLVLGWFFSKTFTTNIRLLKDAAERLSHGDLSQPIELPPTFFQDETHDLAHSLNSMMKSLEELAGCIQNTSDEVAESALQLTATSEQMTASAMEVANASEHISCGAETQAQMVEQCSQLIKDMAVSTEFIANSAVQAAGTASGAAQTAQKGGEVAQTNMAKMKEVLDEVEKNNMQILSFGEKVQKIGTIIEVITNIAQKTNLLALNASIEAVRAGEYGRGFAIVAEEIGKLSDSTGESAGQISRLIENIREENQKVQDSLKETIMKMNLGSNAFDGVSKSFNEIIQAVLESQEKSDTISGLSENQTSLAERIVQTVEEISKVTAENASATVEVSSAAEQQSASMHEMAGAAVNLSRTSEELLHLVSRFQLSHALEKETVVESAGV
jgi:methyl-accepting chemotaxis protein